MIMERRSINPILPLLAALCLTVAPSCQKEAGRIFEESASERIRTTLDEAERLLTGAPYGWQLVEFAGTSDKDYGGMNFAVTFTDTEVTAYFERDTANAYISHYTLEAGDCAMLSFDTYNPHLHLYATPSPSYYEAKGSDFQFALMSVSSEEIVMRGIRMLSPKIGFGFILTAFAAIPVLLLKYREQAVAGAGSVYHTMRRHILWKAVFPTTQDYAAGGWTQQECTQFVFILIAMALVALLEYSDVLMTHTQSSRSGFWIRFLVTFPFLECGLYFGIIVASALAGVLGAVSAKLRHPSRSSKLKDYLED